MQFHLGMREKTALLVVVLVGIASLGTAWALAQRAKNIVIDHELLDLVDETELRARTLADLVGRLREDALALATDHELQRLLENHASPPELAEHCQAVCRTGGQWPSYLRVEVWDGENPPTVVKAEREIAFRPSREMLAGWGLRPHSVFLSPLRRVGAGASEEPAWLYVIWAAAPLESFLPASALEGASQAQAATPPAAGAWLLVALSLEDAVHRMRRSPRHLAFLLDEGNVSGEGPHLVVHPDLNGPQPPSADGRKELADFFEGDDFEEHVRGFLEEDRDAAPQETALAPVARLRTKPLTDQKLAGARYYFREARLSRLPADGVTVRSLMYGEIQDRYERQGRRIGISPERNLLRVLARYETPDQADFERFTETQVKQDLVELFGSERMQGVELAWRNPILCEHCDIAFVRINLASASGVQRLLLAHAVFAEELASSVDYEMAQIRWWGLALALLAGLVAFGVTLWFIRPLQRITHMAGAAGAFDLQADPNDDQILERVGLLRQSLPIARGDEVGDIARALDRLLANVSAGHQQLRDWSHTLELRVKERTSELQDANQKLATANAVLAAQAERLAEVNEQLEGLSREKDQFLANVSHELRTPLNALFGFLQFLEMSDLDENQRSDLQKIRQAATNLLDLINDILDYQKIVMGGLALEPEPIDLPAFLGDIRQSMQFAAQANQNRLTVAWSHDLPPLEADPHRLRQVLVNLVSNACKFTKGGEVTLHAASAQNGQCVEFTVSDTGRGMTPDEQEKLFRRFVKLANKEGNKAGTGLGLVISKGLCDLMGGEIHVESEYGKGSKFTVRIPLVASGRATTDAEKRRTQRAKAEFVPEGDGRAADHTVLVIDDDPGVRELMERYLTQDGFKVVTAADGLEGITFAHRLHPDVITLDALMPELDGWAVLAALKTDSRTASIPVVMITMVDERGRGFALGADDYLIKPIDWEQLSRTLSAFVGADRGRRVLVVDDEPAAREIVRRHLQPHGWKVVEACHGAEALELLDEATPAAIILDLMMPVMDGFEFLEAYSRRPERQSVPVFVMTAKSPTPEERERLEKSVARVMQKGPHTYDELLQEIRRRLGEGVEVRGQGLGVRSQESGVTS